MFQKRNKKQLSLKLLTFISARHKTNADYGNLVNDKVEKRMTEFVMRLAFVIQLG